MERIDFDTNLGLLGIRLAWPTVLENLLVTVIFVADMMFAGLIGTNAVAAVGVGGLIAFTVAALLQALSVGAASIVAKLVGTGNLPDARACALVSSVTAALVGLLSGLALLPFVGAIYRLMGVTPSVASEGVLYLAVLLPFTSMRGFSFVAAAALRGAGDMRGPLVVTGLANLVNILVNALLVTKLGVVGLALATALSLTLSSAAFAFLLRRSLGVRVSDLALARAHLGRVIAVSFPAMLEFMVIRLGFVVFVRLIAGLGTIALAAHSIAVRIESVSFMPSFGFSSAAATLAGQALGGGRGDMAKRSVYALLRTAVLSMTAVGILLALVAPYVPRLFSAEVGVRELASLCVIIAVVEQPILGVFMSLAGGMRGAGYTKGPLLLSVVGVFGVRIPLTLLFVHLGWGVGGAWLAGDIDWGVKALLAYYIFRSGRWAKRGA